MTKRGRRRLSLVLFVVIALGVGIITGVIATTGQSESVNVLWASAAFDPQGNATVHETIDYHFAEERHGIYRVLPDVPLTSANQIDVSSDAGDQVQLLPDANGVKLKIGDPDEKISGDHRYQISYPLNTARLGGDRFGWDGVGAAWDVPIEQAELDLVAPWKWEQPTCNVGGTGSFDECTVSQPEPGHLVVSHGHLDAGDGITVYAERGEPLTRAPVPRTPESYESTQPWWQKPLTLALGAAVLVFLAALVRSWALRRAGRDWVLTGAVEGNSATTAAYSTASDTAGATRVDDTRLAEWTTTEFTPPKRLSAWKGGVLMAERPLGHHRIAWVLDAAIAGYVDLDDADPDAMVIYDRDHASDATTELLEVAFAGRDRVELGKYDKDFAALWASLAAQQRKWLENSGFADAEAAQRVPKVKRGGILGLVIAMVIIQIAAHSTYEHGLIGVIGVAVGALLLGFCAALVVRSWELYVRTPAGSAMWLRVASFRKFLHNSEAEHVRRAAERGVLREYTAWAVALGEVAHWSAMVKEAGLPPTTTGLHTAMAAAAVSSAVTSTGQSSSSGGGGGGVGGGGGGGGGGSW